MEKPKTDSEMVEFCRKEMQALVDRTDFAAPSRKQMLDSTGLPHQAVQLIAADLTELGRFDLELPLAITTGWPKLLVDARRRHWVYRHEDGRIVTLQLSQRVKLRASGFVYAYAFVNDIGARN